MNQMNQDFENVINIIDDSFRKLEDVSINLREDINTNLPIGQLIGATMGTIERVIRENNFVLPVSLTVVETSTETEGKPATIWWYDHGCLKMASLRVDEDWSLLYEENIIEELRADLNL